VSARNRNNFWYGLDHIYATCANTVCAAARAKLVVASFMPPMVFVRADQRHLNDRVTFRAARHARLVAACFRRHGAGVLDRGDRVSGFSDLESIVLVSAIGFFPNA